MTIIENDTMTSDGSFALDKGLHEERIHELLFGVLALEVLALGIERANRRSFSSW